MSKLYRNIDLWAIGALVVALAVAHQARRVAGVHALNTLNRVRLVAVTGLCPKVSMPVLPEPPPSPPFLNPGM